MPTGQEHMSNAFNTTIVRSKRLLCRRKPFLQQNVARQTHATRAKLAAEASQLAQGGAWKANSVYGQSFVHVGVALRSARLGTPERLHFRRSISSPKRFR